MTDIKMTPNRPYLTRAIYEWLIDNQLTPYINVNAALPNVRVPQQFVQDGQIILNIAPHSTYQFEISNQSITFSARFGGISHQIYIPIYALNGIYARENGIGLFFDPNEYDDIITTNSEIEQETQQQSSTTKNLSFVD